MVHLLKQKSKVQSANKPRKSFAALDLSKRRKTEDMDMQNVAVRQSPANVILPENKGQK